jgi:hypothetical protein
VFITMSQIEYSFIPLGELAKLLYCIFIVILGKNGCTWRLLYLLEFAGILDICRCQINRIVLMSFISPSRCSTWHSTEHLVGM